MRAFKRLHAAACGFAAVLLLTFAGGCSSGGHTTDFGDNDPDIVVALGDSITFGKHDGGIEACGSLYRGKLGFTPRLEGLTGKTVINEGVCGEKSSGGRERVYGVLQRWRPAVLLIDYSPNDIVDGPNETIANLRTMIAAARSNKTVPILGTLVPAVGDHDAWESFIEAVNIKILALCDQEGISCADHHQAFMDYPGFRENPYTLLDNDGLHPNAAGYEVMAETWRDPLMRQY